LALVLAAGCASPTPVTQLAPSDTPRPAAAAAVIVTSTTIPPTATRPAATNTPVVVADYCLDCHTDKEQVMSLAKAEEVAETESKGVG
jgi:hypothetical protein